MNRHGRQLIAALAALSFGLVPLTSSAAPPGRPAGSEPGQQGERRSATVTLITGDKVTIRPDGRSWAVQITPAGRVGRPAGGYFQHVTPEQVTVIPVGAVPLIKSGQLDRALFDITGLVRQKLDDAHTREIPLLVKSGPAKAPAFGKVTRKLRQGGLSAVSVPKNLGEPVAAKRAQFDLRQVRPGTRIWLNGRAQPVLDQSIPQIGAPTAWQAGFTGAGVKVAVLDSGYDEKHADLQGAVKATEDFVGEGMTDTVGHGTHVASIVAGRRTASQGRHTGVAKGADLMIGKVCMTDGCPFDAIIAGMQWAAENGAKVVNLSLGGPVSDGTDPLSLELNRLTETTGTLFVVAAGNWGPKGPVTAPATADAALSVASVTKQDQLSPFSSVGPRFGDHALKPDLAAPGSAIVAARAEGTYPDDAVDDHYTRLSGTSMAAPHVAGAAAILAGQHPDWTADQLKAALMGSARPIDANVFAQGTGRVDLARAIKQTVTTSPASVSFKAVPWPHQDKPDQSRKVTYRNTGGQPVTLNLEFAAGRLSSDTLTVPARGTADVTVTVAPSKLSTGTHSGRVIASTADKSTVVQTTVGIHLEPESHDLTLTLVDRNGQADARGAGLIQDLADMAGAPVLLDSGERVRLPVGRYALFAYIATPVPGKSVPSATSGAVPELDFRADQEVRIDARQGRRTGIQLDRAEARTTIGRVATTVVGDDGDTGMSIDILPENYAIPVKGSANFAYYLRARVERPLVALVEEPGLDVGWTADTTSFVGRRAYDTVDVGRARPEDLVGKKLTGKLALFTLTAEDGDVFDASVARLEESGAAAALYYASEPLELTTAGTPIPTMYFDDQAGARLGGRRLTIEGRGASPYLYELAVPTVGEIPADPAYRIRDRQLATVRASYHSAVPGAVGFVDNLPRKGLFRLDAAYQSETIDVPRRRTEYRSPGIEWSSSVAISQAGPDEHQQEFYAPARSYRAGEQLAVAWNKPVLGPGFGAVVASQPGRTLYAFRDGDKLDVLLPMFTDAANHSGFAQPEYGYEDVGATALYTEDGRLIGKSDTPGSGVFTVPAGSGRYRLTAAATRTDPAWPLATRVMADWSFRSATTSKPESLPLLAVRLDPAVDLLGNAPAGRKFTIPVTVLGGKPAKVEVSYDDGKTWTVAVLRGGGGRWTATVQHPVSGYVSLRSTAVDAEGNQVVQTTHRAYRLK